MYIIYTCTINIYTKGSNHNIHTCIHSIYDHCLFSESSQSLVLEKIPGFCSSSDGIFLSWPPSYMTLFHMPLLFPLPTSNPGTFSIFSVAFSNTFPYITTWFGKNLLNICFKCKIFCQFLGHLPFPVTLLTLFHQFLFILFIYLSFILSRRLLLKTRTLYPGNFD